MAGGVLVVAERDLDGNRDPGEQLADLTKLNRCCVPRQVPLDDECFGAPGYGLVDGSLGAPQGVGVPAGRQRPHVLDAPEAPEAWLPDMDVVDGGETAEQPAGWGRQGPERGDRPRGEPRPGHG